VIDWIGERVQEENGIDLSRVTNGSATPQGSRGEAKMELSTLLEATSTCPSSTATPPARSTLADEADAGAFEQNGGRHRPALGGPCKQALADAGVTPSQINEVVMVGGQTRMPRIPAMRCATCSAGSPQGREPDEVVAVGAAVQGGVLAAK